MDNIRNRCPECNSEEFVTEPNRYDVLVFHGNSFDIQSAEIYGGARVFCRECGREIDERKSIEKARIVLI